MANFLPTFTSVKWARHSHKAQGFSHLSVSQPVPSFPATYILVQKNTQTPLLLVFHAPKMHSNEVSCSS